MNAANDQFSLKAETLGLLVQARFLLATLDRYERDPDDEKWQSVCLARQWLVDSVERVEPFREGLLGIAEAATQ